MEYHIEDTDLDEYIGVMYCQDEPGGEGFVRNLRSSIADLPLETVSVKGHYRIVRYGPGKLRTRKVAVRPFVRMQHKTPAE